MRVGTGALTLLLAGWCGGLEAAATESADVLGEPVLITNPVEMTGIILTRLLDQYAAKRAIRAEPAEIDALLGQMRRGVAPEEQPTSKEHAELDSMQRDMALGVIRKRKINKALHDRYGGRITDKQLEPEPLDAYRLFLRQREAAGTFAIHDQRIEDSFWRCFDDASIHDFMAPGSVDEARAFTIPPRKREP